MDIKTVHISEALPCDDRNGFFMPFLITFHVNFSFMLSQTNDVRLWLLVWIYYIKLVPLQHFGHHFGEDLKVVPARLFGIRSGLFVYVRRFLLWNRVSWYQSCYFHYMEN